MPDQLFHLSSMSVRRKTVIVLPAEGKRPKGILHPSICQAWAASCQPIFRCKTKLRIAASLPSISAGYRINKASLFLCSRHSNSRRPVQDLALTGSGLGMCLSPQPAKGQRTTTVTGNENQGSSLMEASFDVQSFRLRRLDFPTLISLTKYI
jgi:hypothetical protein